VSRRGAELLGHESPFCGAVVNYLVVPRTSEQPADLVASEMATDRWAMRSMASSLRGGTGVLIPFPQLESPKWFSRVRVGQEAD
jgi:hypothetical protein